MNVMKQDAMDDKIKERCKTCKKQCMQKKKRKILMDREVSRYCQTEANLDRSTSYREAIEDPEEISIDPPSCREAIEIAIRRS